jgi:hypothetical protein
MRGCLLVGLLLLFGCADLQGPRKRAFQPEKVDVPYLPIPEQEARGRQRLPYPFEGYNNGPRTYAEIPAEQYGRLSH